ncbi:MAG: hypothetical protein M1827_006308 [Pycnora praestabilis]|nr:MAG: hypothetical protein M1827_006308 [Pycnora praestabilis]
MEDHNPELESFRQRWREEVSGRRKENTIRSEAEVQDGASSSKAERTKNASGPPPPTDRRKDIHEDIDEEMHPREYHDLQDKDDAFRLGDSTEVTLRASNSKEPRSALEHYEKAVEKESQGSLGDSLNLYRKAYRLDDRVDQTYKNKYFPPSSFAPKPSNPNPSNAAVTVPNPAHHSLEGPPHLVLELIAEFSTLLIPAAPATTDLSPPPRCPIAAMPSEVLIELLVYTAILDVASFARLAQVCKRFAYLIATEERIWKRVCCGLEVGFGAMHYRWTCDIYGSPLVDDDEDGHILGVDNPEKEREPGLALDNDPRTLSLLHSKYSSSWHTMFRLRPRLRFNGCYISTVNYARPGASSPTQITWNTPVHIVTYYRYLRFFRDGTAVSLLTTAEPVDVVHHLTKDNIHTHHTGALPSAVMKHALRGRWHLSGTDPSSSSSSSTSISAETETEGDVYIETEGPDAKYTYKMDLSLRSAGRGSKNNKLVWRGFWSYNRLTDDWAEFGLRNDRAFFWSRVRSYGMGA